MASKASAKGSDGPMKTGKPKLPDYSAIENLAVAKAALAAAEKTESGALGSGAENL